MAVPWSRDVIKACGRKHDLAVFDRERPWDPQFKGIEVVIDMGGQATEELVDAIAAANLDRYAQGLEPLGLVP